MSTTIAVKLVSDVLELQARRGEQLKTSVDKTVDDAATKLGVPLQIRAIQFSDNKEVVENWETRLVGSRAVTVIAEAGPIQATLNALLARVSAMEQLTNAMAQREAAAWEPRLGNLAAQILLQACGQQKFRTTTTDYYTKMVAENDSGLQQAAAGMGMELAKLAEEADAVLSRRNKNVHPGSLASLEKEVDTVRGCITTELERMCPQECRIVHGYETLKGAFPHRFQ